MAGRAVNGRTACLATVPVLLLIGCASAGDEQGQPVRARPSAPPAPESTPAAPARRGTLRGVGFAQAPVVAVTVCEAPSRSCFPATYRVFVRLTRALPRRARGEVEVALSVTGQTGAIDPIGRPRRPRRCFAQAFFTSTPGSAVSPVGDGRPATVTLTVFDDRSREIGEIRARTTLTRTSSHSEPPFLRAVGC